MIRLNSEYVAILKANSKRDLQMVVKDFNIDGLNDRTIVVAYNKATSSKGQILLIDSVKGQKTQIYVKFQVTAQKMNAKAPGALSLGKYEAKRLRRIEENRRMLLSLNLPTIPRRAKPAPVPKQTQRAEPVMRSGRLRQESIQARQKKRQQDIIMRLQALQLARLQQKQALQLARLQRKQK
ncbi:hypothetical protein PC112_g24127 [Phytophthora cactorum]|uniref:Uncharacterized protein n=1 Tax=Phytophthora cactorum TaxID=29920 RepID=A0A8T1A6C4_9STRA|nr:hypothetical protein PC112_g24127 [Phytophthora cactorum]KAG2873567.1 hypothetical protein PC115_g24332 [Phytophthora cactorum]KAG3045852.1 hypothetical protein PC122_g24487 [Phytophthora cactorum]